MNIIESNNREDINWFTGEYLRYLSAQVSANVAYLNQTVSWSVGIVTASIGFFITQKVIGADDSTHLSTYLATLVVVVFLVHFMGRGIRAYVNVMRFSMLSRMVIDLRIRAKGIDEPPLDQLAELKRSIALYDVKWVCPVSWPTITRKFFGELGFGLMFFVMVASAMCSVWTLPISISLPAALATFGAISMDVFRLKCGSYFKEIEPHPMAENLK